MKINILLIESIYIIALSKRLTPDTKTNDMKTITIEVKKNGKVIKSFESNEKNFQKDFNKAHNFAGGKWNGKDTFTVSSK